MSFAAINLHLENLLPGVVILVCLVLLVPQPAPVAAVSHIVNNQVVASVTFLSAAYLLGLISAVLARWFVEDSSDKYMRPLLFNLRKSHRTYAEFRELLKDIEIRPIDPSKPWFEKYQGWNLIYREALRVVLSTGPEKVVVEVLRRREQGRLVRNIFFPLIFVCAASVKLYYPNAIILAASIPIAAVCSLFLYSAAEYMTFAEASLHLVKATDKKVILG